jgi:DGQHR domain-containing protein
LLQIGVITEWDPNLGWDLDRQGYQRAPVDKHYRRIGQFLIKEDDPLLPTSALLSAREDEYGILRFKPSTANSEFGYLEIPEGREIYIVDYQHRWRGLKYAIEEKGAAKLGNFQIPVVIMANARRYEEIRQFYLINSKQRRIDTDLALALMQTMATSADESELINLAGPGKRYRIRATRLTFRLAAMPAGCWAGRIQEPNMVPAPQQIASPKSFADSLRPILSSRCPLHSLSDDSLLQVIMNYWEGIKSLLPRSFKEPRNYAIQKTPGLFSMHRVGAQKVLLICQRQDDYSPKNVAAILSSATDYMKESFWVTSGPITAYGGAGGHKALADKIIAQLP